MRKPKPIHKIEDDTVLLPWVIADQVVREVAVYLQREIPPALGQYLSDRAQRHYEHSAHFYTRTRGVHGREHLYAFMRHWATAWVDDTYAIRMPDSFANGEQLNPTERYVGPKGWELKDVLALGLVEMGLPPIDHLPELTKIQKFKIHRSFRLTDGMWHMFRYTDISKAEARDRELDGPMLPARG